MEKYEEFNPKNDPTSLIGLPDIVEEIIEEDSKLEKFKVSFNLIRLIE